MTQTSFEDGTRAAAVEVALSVAEEMPAALRKAPETKTQLFPALTRMLMEVEKDEAAWSEAIEDPDMVESDPVSTAMSSITRLAEALGEKTTLAATQAILNETI